MGPATEMCYAVRRAIPHAVRLFAAAAVCVVVALLVSPPGASAEQLCTDTFSPTEGGWQTASNWSAGHAPTSIDVACIGESKTAKVTEGSNQAGMVQGKGTLAISGGTLEVANAMEPSTIGALALSATTATGTLSGPAEVDVTGSFSESGGQMEGTGSTVIKLGATGSFNSTGPNLELKKRTLVNEGSSTVQYPGAGISGSEGAMIVNRGTLTINSEGEIRGLYLANGASASLVNTGTVRKTEGTGLTRIGWAVDNEKTINAASGKLDFFGGGSSGKEHEETWSAGTGAAVQFGRGSFTLGSAAIFSGTVRVSGATVSAGKVEGAAATLAIESEGCCEPGKVELTGPGASTVQNLTMAVTTLVALKGTGEVDVSGSLSASAGKMEGTGTTVIKPGATATISGSGLALVKRTLVNEGSLTIQYPEGTISGAEGGGIVNRSTLTINGQGEGVLYAEGATNPKPKLVNTGIVQKTEGTGIGWLGWEVDNESTVTAKTGQLKFDGGGTSGKETPGSWSASTGAAILFGQGTYSLGSTVPLSGAIKVVAATVAAGKIEASAASLYLEVEACCAPGTLELTGPGVSIVRDLTFKGTSLTTLTGAAELDVTGTFQVPSGGRMQGTGSTVLKPGVTGTIDAGIAIDKRTLINEGHLLVAPPAGSIAGSENARLENLGTLTVNREGEGAMYGANTETPLLINLGVFQKTEGTFKAWISWYFNNAGVIKVESGEFKFDRPELNTPWTEYGGPENESAPEEEKPTCGEDVNCATGNLSKTQTDFAIGGRGAGLDLTRTYNSQAAAENVKGVFGYGWANSFSDHLTVEKTSQKATLHQADGSAVAFKEGTGGAYTAPAWSQDVLSGSEASGYTLTLKDQTVYKFAGATGRLETVTDRNGNATTVEYDETGRLKAISDPAGRKITLKYNAEGLVESAEDPMKHAVTYTYASGNLATVTQPAETALRWQFPKYDGSHQLEELIDGRGGKWVNKYNASHQVIEQADALLPARTTTFEYKPFETRTTNHATGAVTVNQTTSTGLAAATVHGYGTSSATSEITMHDASSNLVSVTDGNNHTTKYTYDTHANRLTMLDPNSHETKWTYNSTHDVETETKPNGEKTTYKRESRGNPEVVERPAPNNTTQITKYTYNSHGQALSMEDPLKRVWKYEYDNAGDRTEEADPENDKRTWRYNENSQETATVSPRGHVKAGEEAKYTTETERDAQGRAIKVTDPLKHETKYRYDGNGNLEVKTDPELHETTYTYDADNEREKVKEPSGTITESSYDGAGQVKSQTDGNGHPTRYERNILEQVTEVIDPLKRATLKKYDNAGNLTSVTDAAKRITTRKYDPANRLIEVTYSDGKTPTVKYEYNENGDRTKMEDGSGTTTYEYDQLDRLTATKDGHGNTSGYEYDLANEQSKITYPNGKAVTREFDNAGRLKSVTDWLAHTTKFTYDADADLTATAFPTGTSNEDTYAYDATDAMSEVKMAKGAETLASLVYARNKNGQVNKATTVGLPGEALPAFNYDKNSRLTKGANIPYKYDQANNPTTIGANAYKYDIADQLEKSEVALTKAPVATYSYDEIGERTKTTPASGSATTYGYNQANNVTSVERPAGEKAEIKDTYAYNGDGIRTSQTISGTTTYLAWDPAEKLPLVLNDGNSNYIYGPVGLPIVQMSNAEAVLYLHHDQQGSTRLLTNATGENVGVTTYDAYGNVLKHEGASTSAFGYDGQYTDADTGLIYLRARYYDPATGQFVSVDPRQEQTEEAYGYASDDPINLADQSGECAQASASRVQGRLKPSPCFTRALTPKGVGRIGITTTPTPTVTWSFDVPGKFSQKLLAAGYAPQGVNFTQTILVNGRLIKGPKPKIGESIDYWFHGAIGPKIYGNKRLRVGDIVDLTVALSGTAANASGSRLSFSATAHEVCEVT
jgi:RHS repeat-associated protein